jgi:hypothetical protein
MSERNLAMRFSVALISLLVMTAGMTGASAQVTNRSEHQPIDCAASRLSVPGQHHCRIWSVDYNARQRPSVWHEDSIPGAACTQEDGSARIGAPRLFGSVRYMMPSPGAHFDCAVSGRLSINLNRMRSISEVTEAATDMAYPQSSGDRFVSTFTSDKGLACRAFILLGPATLTRYHNRDSREYRILGYVCPREGAVLTDPEFEAFLGSIQLRRG